MQSTPVIGSKTPRFSVSSETSSPLREDKKEKDDKTKLTAPEPALEPKLLEDLLFMASSAFLSPREIGRNRTVSKDWKPFVPVPESTASFTHAFYWDETAYSIGKALIPEMFIPEDRALCIAVGKGLIAVEQARMIKPLLLDILLKPKNLHYLHQPKLITALFEHRIDMRPKRFADCLANPYFMALLRYSDTLAVLESLDIPRLLDASLIALFKDKTLTDEKLSVLPSPDCLPVLLDYFARFPNEKLRPVKAATLWRIFKDYSGSLKNENTAKILALLLSERGLKALEAQKFRFTTALSELSFSQIADTLGYTNIKAEHAEFSSSDLLGLLKFLDAGIVVASTWPAETPAFTKPEQAISVFTQVHDAKIALHNFEDLSAEALDILFTKRGMQLLKEGVFTIASASNKWHEQLRSIYTEDRVAVFKAIAHALPKGTSLLSDSLVQLTTAELKRLNHPVAIKLLSIGRVPAEILKISPDEFEFLNTYKDHLKDLSLTQNMGWKEYTIACFALDKNWIREDQIEVCYKYKLFHLIAQHPSMISKISAADLLSNLWIIFQMLKTPTLVTLLLEDKLTFAEMQYFIRNQHFLSVFASYLTNYPEAIELSKDEILTCIKGFRSFYCLTAEFEIVLSPQGLKCLHDEKLSLTQALRPPAKPKILCKIRYGKAATAMFDLGYTADEIERVAKKSPEAIQLFNDKFRFAKKHAEAIFNREQDLKETKPLKFSESVLQLDAQPKSNNLFQRVRNITSLSGQKLLHRGVSAQDICKAKPDNVELLGTGDNLELFDDEKLKEVLFSRYLTVDIDIAKLRPLPQLLNFDGVDEIASLLTSSIRIQDYKFFIQPQDATPKLLKKKK